MHPERADSIGGDRVNAGKPVPSDGGWVAIPNETARDPRLTRPALGLLVEMLSHPQNWNHTAERLAMVGRGGLETTTTAWGCLEVAGYIVRFRYRGPRGQMQSESFAGNTPAVARELAEAWIAAHPDIKPLAPNEGKSHERARKTRSEPHLENQGPVDHGPVTRGPNTNKESKTESKKEEPGAAGAAPRQPDAIASGIPTDDADASRAAAHATASDSSTAKQPAVRTAKNRPLPLRLDTHLAGLGADRLDGMIDVLEVSRGGVLDWAAKTARKDLGLSWDTDYREDPAGPYARKTLGLALMRLRKENGGGIPDEIDLDGFIWPEPYLPACKAPREPAERPYTECLPYAKGADPDAVLRALYGGVDAMGDEARRLMGIEFGFHKPRVFQDCETEARKQLDSEGSEATPDALLSLTLKYGQQRYSRKGKCPKFLVPKHLRTRTSAASGDAEP